MAQSVQISVAGAGNATENKNLINPRFQAEALRQLRGYDTGVLKNSFFTETSPKGMERTNNDNFMWKLDVSGGVSNIRVGRGMATAFGYDIQSETEVTLSTTPPAANNKYVFIYLEWDLHNTQIASGTIKLHDNGSSDNWTPPNQDNLITNPIGTYQMILYRLTVNTSGAITATSNWELFGTRTIGYPLRSENANFAENYNPDNGTLKEKFNEITSTFTIINGKLNELGFNWGTITFAGNSISSHEKTTLNNGIYKQGKYVILRIKNYTHTPTGETIRNFYVEGKTLFTIPEEFKPMYEQIIPVLVLDDYMGEIGAVLYVRIPTSGVEAKVQKYEVMDGFMPYNTEQSIYVLAGWKTY